MKTFVAVLLLLVNICTALPSTTTDLTTTYLNSTGVFSLETRDNKKCYFFLHLRESPAYNMVARPAFFRDDYRKGKVENLVYVSAQTRHIESVINNMGSWDLSFNGIWKYKRVSGNTMAVSNIWRTRDILPCADDPFFTLISLPLNWSFVKSGGDGLDVLMNRDSLGPGTPTATEKAASMIGSGSAM
jgi:hypothetical protein